MERKKVGCVEPRASRTTPGWCGSPEARHTLHEGRDTLAETAPAAGDASLGYFLLRLPGPA